MKAVDEVESSPEAMHVEGDDDDDDDMDLVFRSPLQSTQTH